MMLRKCAVFCLGFLPLCLGSVPQTNADDMLPAHDLRGFPKLTGKLVKLLGHEGGFVRPKPGEPFHLDLANLSKVGQLRFDRERTSYIPLPGRLSVEAVHYFPNGKFESMRLTARNEHSRVTIDIVPTRGESRNRVMVWFVVENKVVQGVALIECEAEGEFPNRR